MAGLGTGTQFREQMAEVLRAACRRGRCSCADEDIPQERFSERAEEQIAGMPVQRRRSVMDSRSVPGSACPSAQASRTFLQNTQNVKNRARKCESAACASRVVVPNPTSDAVSDGQPVL